MAAPFYPDIRQYGPLDRERLLAVARALGHTPEKDGWFTEDGIREIGTDLEYQRVLVAETDGEVVGFVTWYANEGKGHIGWIGVLPEHHRRGLGRKLVGEAARDLLAHGVSEVFVDTLGASVKYEPYERTRAFYHAVGFRDFQKIMQPENADMPERLILVAKTSEFPEV